jgi:hypothetical protein
MTNKLKLSASAAALALLIAGGATSVKAADVVEEPGCTLSGSVMVGYMYDWQKTDIDTDEEIEDKDLDGDVDWETPFGEGAGLVTCGGFNVQADFAYYAHSTDVDLSDLQPGIGDKDEDQTNSHLGAALFYRDPSAWALGLEGSWISQDVLGKDVDIFRVGVFGEFYFDDIFTLGASAHYYDTDDSNLEVLGGKDEDGVELALWGRFYATPDLSLMVRGDVLWADTEWDATTGGPSQNIEGDLDGWAITGEAEYLVWDQGLSIFGGARYAERTLEISADEVDTSIDFDADDFQVYAGIKFYFGMDGTLIERQRTGTVDNTSVWNEKLPNMTASTIAGLIDAAGGAP